MRPPALALAALGCMVLLATVPNPPAPRLVWNLSASAPSGLYRVRPGHNAKVGDLVAARVPERWRSLAATRRYIPINVPLVKRVAAADGDLVCARGKRITINQRRAAVRLAHDAHGRPLPRWTGCLFLQRGEYLLLMDGKGSFDGRYFGPTRADELVGTARLIWPA